MRTLQSMMLACLLALAAPAALAAVPEVPEIAPTVAKEASAKCQHGDMDKMAHGEMGGMACCKGKQDNAKGGCDKCKQGGMGKMAHGDIPGMTKGGCCCRMGGMRSSDPGDTAALERRIAELEKRLDLMQQLLIRSGTR